MQSRVRGRFTLTLALLCPLAGSLAGCNAEETGLPDAGADMSMTAPADGGDGDLSMPTDGGAEPSVLLPGAADRLLLRGTLLAPAGPMAGELLIEQDRITCVAASCAEQTGAAGATVIQTTGVIMPGLIDAHNHGLFNIFDEQDWTPPRIYNNHNDWTSDTRYKQVVDAKQYLNSEDSSPVDLRCEVDKYAEIKALIAGTTSFTLAPGAVELACYQSLARTIDTARNGLGRDKLRTSISVPSEDTAVSVCSEYASGATNAYAIHIAEGKNATARNEFTTLSNRAGKCLLAKQTTIVHGTALGADEFKTMGDNGMRLVWSPKSNLFLYNQTTDIKLAIESGIKTIAIAPDWALGGSVNMLDELRVARKVSDENWQGLLSPQRLFEMATIEPARALGVDDVLGSLEVGKRADVIIVNGDAAKPYETLLATTPTQVGLVMVGGRVLYGDRSLKSAGNNAPACEEIQICGTTKFLCVAESSTQNKLNQTYAEIVQALTSGLKSYDEMVAAMSISAFTPLAPLLRCQ